MRKALYFEDALDFCDFVRLCGPDTKSSTEGLPFELCRVVHPTRPGESALVLFHCQPPLKRELREIVTLIEAEVDLAGNTLFWNLPDSAHSPLTGRDQGHSLLEFIELQPWKPGCARSSKGPVLFWISDNSEERGGLLARLIRDSLRLGNDRIQFGPIASQEGENAATLLRIESPSFFLIQACLEELAESVHLFYPAGDAHFVRWGFTHPLESWWRQSNPDATGEWVFFRDQTDYVHVTPVAWQDAYRLADLTLEFPHREIWTGAPTAPRHFEVPLTLERQRSDREPELWLLDENGVRRLEATLQITDEETLRAWQIAVQRMDDDERDRIFIRETHAGKKRRHHDFAGLGFARYQGLNNLYLPVGFELLPPLRRDAYRDLFQLDPDTLTVIAPDEDGSSENSFRILKIREKAFNALSSFVDHIVQRDADILKSLMAESLFDFGHYLKAPSHPGLSPEAGAKSPKDLAESADSETEDDSKNTRTTDLEAPDPNALADRLAKSATNGADESRLSGWQKEELRLERELVDAGQSADRWAELLEIKERLGKPAEAVLCAIEALWLPGDSEVRESLYHSLAKLVESSFEPAQDPAMIGPSEPESLRRAATFALILQRPEEPEDLDRWIVETIRYLQSHESGLRAKERWLAWGAVLAANRDLRRETRLREEIRNRITERGLSLEDTPAFIRSRIYLDRNTAGEIDDSNSGFGAALENLKILEKAQASFESSRLGRVFSAILDRAHVNAAVSGALREPFSEAHEPADSASAWATLFQIDALREIDPALVRPLEEQFEDHLSRSDPETVRAIRDLEKVFQERSGTDDPAAFLARENRSRTYPRGAGTETGLLYELSLELGKASLAGSEADAIRTMHQMMSLEDPGEYDDPVKLPQFVETLVAGLERFKWGERGAGLIPIFENFTDRAPGFLSGPPDSFYGAILHSNLALGLLTVENLEKAHGQLTLAAEAAARNTVELEFIDSASAVVRTVEQLPLNRRAPFLELLIGAFAGHFDVEKSPYIANERLFAVLVKSLNQMAEAASSKDRLSLEQFRHYQLQDEFLILQRIQSENFCADGEGRENWNDGKLE